MHGTPFDALKTACTHMAGSIFGEDESRPEDNMFEQVHTVFYDQHITTSVANNKSQYLAKLQAERIGGSTNFIICYDKILEFVRGAPDGT